MKTSSTLKGTSAALFAMGGISALGLLAGKKQTAVPAAALFTFLGGALLVADALIHPENIKIPDVSEINIPTVKVEL
jgi:hypothetical protein